jgi:hypothetical protein
MLCLPCRDLVPVCTACFANTGSPTYEYTYVESNITESPYFASKCKLSTEGGLTSAFASGLHTCSFACLLCNY